MTVHAREWLDLQFWWLTTDMWLGAGGKAAGQDAHDVRQPKYSMMQQLLQSCSGRQVQAASSFALPAAAALR